MNKKLIRKMLTAAGGPLRIKFTPEEIALFESQATRVPGMNNSGGNRYRKEGVLALLYLEQEAKRKEEEIKSRMEMRPTLKRRATFSEKLRGKKDEYVPTTQIVGMSGADPLLSFYVGGVGLNGIGALAKTGLWNIAKYAPTTLLGNWGKGYFIGNTFKNSFNGAVSTLAPLLTSKNLFRTKVYKGGEITDPYSNFVTTDPKYAANYGKVTPYIFESKSIAKAKEPMMGSSDPVTMDMFIYNNTKRNPNATAIIGHDAVTGEFQPSKGIEIYSMSPTNLFKINNPEKEKIFTGFKEQQGLLDMMNNSHNAPHPPIYERVSYSKYSADATNPKERDLVIQHFKSRYPNSGLQITTPLKISGFTYDNLLKVGELPLSEEGKAIADVMARRMKNYKLREGLDPNVVHFGGSRISMSGINGMMNQIKNDKTIAYMPLKNSDNYGGLYEGGEALLKLNPWREKPYIYSLIHEGVSHMTDDFVTDLRTPVSGKKLLSDLSRNFDGTKTSNSMYGRISYPNDIYDEKLIEKILHKDSMKAIESRSTNWEMITDLYRILAKEKGISYKLATELPDSEFGAFVEKTLDSPEKLSKFMEKFDNLYLLDYSNLMKAGTKELANQFYKRIKGMLKYGPSLITGGYFLTSQKQGGKMNKKLIRKMQTAAGGPIFITRDINGNWVYMDIKTGRTTSAGPETGTIRNNTVNSVGGDNKTKQGRTKIALKQVTSYNNKQYKVHNYADTTTRLKLKNQDVVLDEQGEPEIIQADYTPTLEAPMKIVSPEFDLLTLGRQAATSIYKAAKPTVNVTADAAPEVKSATTLSLELIEQAFNLAKQWHLNRINSPGYKDRALRAGFTEEEIPLLLQLLTGQINRLKLQRPEDVFPNIKLRNNYNGKTTAGYWKTIDNNNNLLLGISFNEPNMSYDDAVSAFVHELGHGATFGINGPQELNFGATELLADQFPLITRAVKYNRSLYPEVTEETVRKVLPSAAETGNLGYCALPTEILSRGYEFMRDYANSWWKLKNSGNSFTTLNVIDSAKNNRFNSKLFGALTGNLGAYNFLKNALGISVPLGLGGYGLYNNANWLQQLQYLKQGGKMNKLIKMLLGGLFKLTDYIKAIENPDSIGWNGRVWAAPTLKGYDKNQRGFGIDVNTNKEARALTEGRPGRWLTDREANTLMNNHINYITKAANKHIKGFSKLSPKRQAALLGMLYRGDSVNKSGINIYEPNDHKFFKSISNYYRSKGLNTRADNSDKFFNISSKLKMGGQIRKMQTAAGGPLVNGSTRVEKPIITTPKKINKIQLSDDNSWERTNNNNEVNVYPNLRNDKYIQEFFLYDYAPRFKRLNNFASQDYVNAALDIYKNTPINIYNEDNNVGGYKTGGKRSTYNNYFANLINSSYIPSSVYLNEKFKLNRPTLVHELTHAFRLGHLGITGDARFSSTKRPLYNMINEEIGNKYFGSGYSDSEKNILDNTYNMKGYKINYDPLWEKGTTNTETRFRLWKELYDKLGRRPSLEETDEYIRTYDGEKLLRIIRNANAYGRTMYDNGMLINLIKNALINVAQNNSNNAYLLNDQTYYAKRGGILEFLKNGSGIHIKEKNKGSFTRWCGGNVTEECIRRGKNSPNAAIRKRATFADNARHFKHKSGGLIVQARKWKHLLGGNLTFSNPNAFGGVFENVILGRLRDWELQYYRKKLKEQQALIDLLLEQLKSDIISNILGTAVNTGLNYLLKSKQEKAT